VGKGFQEWEEKRAEAKIAHRIVQIPLMEAYDLHVGERLRCPRDGPLARQGVKLFSNWHN